MAKLSWIHMFFLMLLEFQAKASAQFFYTTVTSGANVTLSCDEATKLHECTEISWIFKRSDREKLDLVTSGEMKSDQSGRLSFTETCALAINNVTVKDVGLYNCSQKDSNTLVYVSIVTLTERTTGDKVTVNCSVLGFGTCEHTVTWLREGEAVKPENKDEPCSASVSFLNTSRPDSLQCKVTQHNGIVLHVAFGLQASKGQTAWWWFVVGGLVALIIIAAVVIRHKARKGTKRQENNENKDEPDDGVSYASVNFKKKKKKKSSREAQVQIREEGDDEDAVTYSTVKAVSKQTSRS